MAEPLFLCYGFTKYDRPKKVIEQFKALPPKERAKVAKFVIEFDESWIPDSFKRGMADAAAARFAEDMETVLRDAPPPSRQQQK